jgi:hypothetical protein
MVLKNHYVIFNWKVNGLLNLYLTKIINKVKL